MKRVTLSLYIIIGLFLTGKLALVLVESSSILHHNAVVADLESDRATLADLRTDLLAQQSSQTAMHILREQADEQYIPITTTKLVRASSDQLAALE